MARQIACHNMLSLYWRYRPICCAREVAYPGGAQVVDFLRGAQILHTGKTTVRPWVHRRTNDLNQEPASRMNRKHTALSLALGAGMALPSAALADAGKPQPGVAKTAPAPVAQKVPWRGSSVSLSNTFNVRQLDQGADLTWNPYDVMAFNVSPRFWFGDHLHLRGSLTLSKELTDPDDETFSGEVRFADTTVGVGYSAPKIPVIGVVANTSLDLRLPTSKYSKYQGLNMGLHGGLSLTRSFKLLEGLSLTYFFGLRSFFHEYTTAGRDDPSITGASRGPRLPTLDIASNDFMNSGVRNTSWQFIHSGSVSMGFTSWFSASVSVAAIQSKLYDLQETAANDGAQQLASADDRYAMNYTVSLGFQPWDVVGFSLSSDTSNPQLDPTVGETYYTPFFNRFTNIVAAVRLNVGAFK